MKTNTMLILMFGAYLVYDIMTKKKAEALATKASADAMKMAQDAVSQIQGIG